MKTYTFYSSESSWEFSILQWSFRTYKAKTLCITNLKIRHLIHKEIDDLYWSGYFARTKKEKTRLRTHTINRYRKYLTDNGCKVVN